MDLYYVVLILHILGFVYWLGGDAAVYYSSSLVVRSDLSNEARVIAAKIMINMDMLPRICMTLMLTLGGTLVDYLGLPHPQYYTLALWILAPFWLWMVLTIHHKEGTDLAKKLTKIDYLLRWVLVIGILLSQAWAWADGSIAATPWLSAKIVIFSGLIFCGLMIRLYIGDYILGIQKMARGEIMTDEDNEKTEASLHAVRPYVYFLWGGVFVSAVLGVVKPWNTAALLY